MKIITAKILDSTHLELSQSIPIPAGESIKISIPTLEDEGYLWQKAAKKQFLQAYAEDDAIYDEL